MLRKRVSVRPSMQKPPLTGRLRIKPSGSRQLDSRDGDLAAAAVLGGVERHLLAIGQTADAGALQRGGMDEDVLAAVVGLDETEALLGVVELHGARIHGNPFTKTG